MTDYPIAPDGSSVANLVASLREAGSEYAGSVSGHTGKFTCPNPGHKDENASFDVTVGSNGKAVFNCSPCASNDRDEWIDALRDAGIVWHGETCKPEEVDWGPAAEVVGRSAGGKKDHGPEIGRTVYTYRKKNGKLNFKVARINYADGSKRFVVRHTDAEGNTVYRLPDDVTRTPLHVEEFDSYPEGSRIILTEGEKACEALNALGSKYAATTFHGGTNAPMHPRWTEWFKRFEVAVWPDADEVGVEWAKQRVLDLREAGIPARLVGVTDEGLAASDDAFDAIERGVLGSTHVLNNGELKRMASLKPKPKVAGNDGVREIVSAKPPVPIDKRRPYSTALNVEPYVFAAEVNERNYTDESGIATLRWQPTEQTFWFWEPSKGHYVALHTDEIKAQVERILQDAKETTVEGVRGVSVKPKNVNEIIEGLRTYALVSPYGRGALLDAAHGVPFLNGWLDAKTGVLKPLGPDRDVRWVVPAEFSDDAECPEWIAFLDSIGYGVETAEYRLIRQWFGYLLSGRTDLHKGLLLIGPKRAGKGTILHVAEALMGDGATATTLERFDPNRTFGLANLIGKSLATIGDARWGRNNPGLNAQLLTATGGDYMPIERKHKDAIPVRMLARLMIASNNVPQFYEASDALASRFVLLEFTKSFYGSEDHELEERLRSELPGIARWALDGLTDLMEVGRFSETERGLELQEQVARDASPIRRFVEEECEVDPRYVQSKDDLWRFYKRWADDENVFAGSKSKFFSDLNASFPGKFGTQRGQVAGKRVQQVTGLRHPGDG